MQIYTHAIIQTYNKYTRTNKLAYNNASIHTCKHTHMQTHNTNIPKIQACKNTRNTRIQCKSTTIQEYTHTRTQYKNTTMQEYTNTMNSTRIQDYTSTRIQGHKNTRIPEFYTISNNTRRQEHTNTIIQDNKTIIQEFTSTRIQTI